MIEGKKTVTSIFMSPLLKIKRETLKKLGFINAYVKDGERDVQYDNSIYMVFKPLDLEEFREFLDEEYERTKNIIEDYDYVGGFVVVVYKLDSTLRDDINLIRAGRYSKTSPRFQQEFPKNVKIHTTNGIKEEVSLQFRVFNKTPDMIKYWEDKLGVQFDKEQEVWYMFDEDQETLSISKLLEHV
jgi:hypothetical protein